jgi:hypothetical protein
MKIGSIAVVVVLVAFLALGQEVLAQNDEMSQAEMSAYFERQLRDFVFSAQQIWSNAGEGAQYVTNALDQLETSLNRPVFSEIWGNITSELEGTPFSGPPFPLDLDPSILIDLARGLDSSSETESKRLSQPSRPTRTSPSRALRMIRLSPTGYSRLGEPFPIISWPTVTRLQITVGPFFPPT